MADFLLSKYSLLMKVKHGSKPAVERLASEDLNRLKFYIEKAITNQQKREHSKLGTEKQSQKEEPVHAQNIEMAQISSERSFDRDEIDKKIVDIFPETQEKE